MFFYFFFGSIILFFVLLEVVRFKTGWFKKQFEKKGHPYYPNLSPKYPEHVEAYLASLKKWIRRGTMASVFVFILYAVTINIP